jgi:hypothetical protein
MSCGTTNVKFKLRRDTSTNWYNANPVLQSGEPGYDTTVNSLKIGDGHTPWNLLPFLSGSGAGNTGPTGPTGPVAPAIGFDGGYPSISYPIGPVFDCGTIV